MKTQYRTVDVTTVAGIRTAERLQAAGWAIIRGGLFSYLMRKGK